MLWVHREGTGLPLQNEPRHGNFFSEKELKVELIPGIQDSCLQADSLPGILIKGPGLRSKLAFVVSKRYQVSPPTRGQAGAITSPFWEKAADAESHLRSNFYIKSCFEPRSSFQVYTATTHLHCSQNVWELFIDFQRGRGKNK